jgi:recombination protein RecT
MANNELVPPKQKMANLRALLGSDGVRRQILTALPRHIDGKRMFRVYLTAVQTTPRILECDSTSVIGAVIQASQLGLSLDTVFGEGFIIPRWNKNAGCNIAQFQIGYKGLRKLAFQADDTIRDIYARVVFENDVFDMSYEPKMIRHAPSPDPTLRGKLKHAYAKVIWKEDYDRFVVLGQPEIDKAKNSSDSFKKGYGPWIEHEEAMWAKTALRRLADTLTLSSDSGLVQALTAEETDSRTVVTGLDLDLSHVQSQVPAELVAQQQARTLPQPSGLDRLAAQGAAPQPAAAPAQAPQVRRRRSPAPTNGEPAQAHAQDVPTNEDPGPEPPDGFDQDTGEVR